MYSLATVASTILFEALGMALFTFSLSAVNKRPIVQGRSYKKEAGVITVLLVCI